MTSSQSFNIDQALLLAKMSRRAYESFEKDYLAFAMDLEIDGFRLISIFVNDETDTEGFLAENDSFAVLCFRGTMEIPRDIFTDVAGRMVDGMHEGVFRAFNSVRSKIESALTLVGNKPVFCAGHSLGGALAKMAVLHIKNANWSSCYTFGSPPICNREFENANLVPIYRIVNEGDIVPRIMEIETVGELGSLLVSSVNKLINGRDIRQPQISDAEKYVRQMQLDLKNYSHIGEVRFFNRDGRNQTGKECMQIFLDAIREDWKAAIEDHKITQYIVNIERYVKNSIML